MRQAFYYSIASAAVAGLLFGGVMKLGPDALAETGGPRILVTGVGKRAVAPEYNSGGVLFASRNGEIPEYVIGTDWTQPVDFALAGAVDFYGDPRVATAIERTPCRMRSRTTSRISAVRVAPSRLVVPGKVTPPPVFGCDL